MCLKMFNRLRDQNHICRVGLSRRSLSFHRPKQLLVYTGFQQPKKGHTSAQEFRTSAENLSGILWLHKWQHLKCQVATCWAPVCSYFRKRHWTAQHCVLWPRHKTLRNYHARSVSFWMTCLGKKSIELFCKNILPSGPRSNMKQHFYIDSLNSCRSIPLVPAQVLSPVSMSGLISSALWNGQWLIILFMKLTHLQGGREESTALWWIWWCKSQNWLHHVHPQQMQRKQPMNSMFTSIINSNSSHFASVRPCLFVDEVSNLL